MRFLASLCACVSYDDPGTIVYGWIRGADRVPVHFRSRLLKALANPDSNIHAAYLRRSRLIGLAQHDRPIHALDLVVAKLAIGPGKIVPVAVQRRIGIAEELDHIPAGIAFRVRLCEASNCVQGLVNVADQMHEPD